jgi:hypothetical protein
MHVCDSLTQTQLPQFCKKLLCMQISLIRMLNFRYRERLCRVMRDEPRVVERESCAWDPIN